MDMRSWFLLNERPTAAQLRDAVRHIPYSEYRSPSVLRLFLAGFGCGFKLTTARGEPTDALRLMAKMMGAELCQSAGLAPEEREAFSQPGPCLIDIVEKIDSHWYLRGITKRFVAANATGNMNPWANGSDWHQQFLRGWDGQRLAYKDPDGKIRRRVCVIAKCRPDWEMNDDVYLGVFRWTRENVGPPDKFRGFGAVPWPDAYSLLREDATIRTGTVESEAGWDVQAAGSTPESRLPPAAVGVQHRPTEGPFAVAGD